MVNAIIKLQAEHTILILENYKANFCIFLQDLYNFENNSLEDDPQGILREKMLNAMYVALKGDIYSSPNFDTLLNISIIEDHIMLCLSGNDQSKFRASILSLLRLINLIYLTLFTTT